ncbi:hypothetical protein SLU01_21240 [Sporosarcina luteola]|uniref:Uncharacterized protein n=1 Tax=Sporosarcina luteola TaxID=582850 RepID=A0A511Z8M8_9BACL|nr:hypothetical protein [Sporosarcina luteola]GEN83812.1 hypothetical protein SLU01_21240 [Sporosarcina luteola]
MLFKKNRNPYSNNQYEIDNFSDEKYPVILHFTPTAIYVYEDKMDSHIIQDGCIKLWDEHETVLTGTLIVTYVSSIQEALEKYKVNELGLLVIPVEFTYED